MLRLERLKSKRLSKVTYITWMGQDDQLKTTKQMAGKIASAVQDTGENGSYKEEEGDAETVKLWISSIHVCTADCVFNNKAQTVLSLQ